MRLAEVVRYELEHRLTSRATLAYAVVLFGIALAIALTGGPTSAAVQRNAPADVATLMLFLGLFATPITAALFGDAAVRDVQAGMDPLLYTTPLRTLEFLAGRWLAALAANALVLLAVPVALALPALAGFQGAGAYGPFRAAAYLAPWLLLQIPNAAFTGALLFAVGARSRRMLPVYLVTALLFFVYVFTLGPGGEARGPLVSVFAPLGFHALNEITELWTPAERNARLVGASAHLLLNRLVWLAAAALVLAALHRRFRFAHAAEGGGRHRRAATTAPVPASRPRLPMPLAIPRVAGAFARGTTLRQGLAIARESLAETAGSRWFAATLLACVGLTLLWGWNVGSSVFDTSTWPLTFLVAETVLSERVVALGYLLVAVYAGEMVWSDRDAGVSDVADALPVGDGTRLLGRALALAALLAAVHLACALGGVLIQAAQGYFRFEPGLYLRIVLGVDLSRALLLAALAMAVHALVNHKALGHLLVVTALVLTKAAPRLGVRHHLLVYGTTPDWTYSDMNGFGPFARPVAWFTLYWGAWALLLGVVAALCWVRGREEGAGHRLRLARARLAGAVARTAGVAVALVLLLGGFVFYNTNVLNHRESIDAAGARLAAYERRYGRWAHAAQPTLVDARLRIDIRPERRALAIAGTYRLVNRTAAPIDSVHVLVLDDVTVRALRLDRPARAVLEDAAHGYRVFRLDRPLAPGDSLGLSFEVAHAPRGFRDADEPTAVTAGGAHFDRSWLPFVGYQPALELADPDARRRQGLAPRATLPGPDDAGAGMARGLVRNEDRVQVDAVIGTSPDQAVITPGRLLRAWSEDGRRWFHFRTERPTSFGMTVVSARYAERTAEWTPPAGGPPVALRILHHPSHVFALDRAMRGMRASLDYYAREFGPYPDARLTLAEVPRYGGFGHALPHTITFTEDYFISRVRDGELDLPFYGVAHEVAHQWWPGQATGAAARGHGLLSESLANYSAMMVTERAYGAEAARRVYDVHMDRYLRGRASQSGEVPLLEVTEQPYLAYRKGAIALYALRERLGEAAVNGALRRYLARFRDAGPPYPTSRDLIDALRAAAPDSLRPLVADLFETVTLWDVRAERGRAERTASGAWAVTFDVVARKLRADATGRETEVPMDDLVEVGVWAHGGDDSTGPALHLAPHRVHSGRQTIRLTVPTRPEWAGVDPRYGIIDRRRDDDVTRLRPPA